MFGLLPKNLEFFDCFEKAAEKSVRSAELLSAFAKEPRKNRLLAEAIHEVEHDCDKITHETLDRLEQTYITPIDRDDIYRMITGIDNVVDTIDAVAQRVMCYKIEEATNDFKDQCDVLVRACRTLRDAVHGLRSIADRKMRKTETSLDQLIIAVHQAEEEGDRIHHHFLGQLFESGLDAYQVIKWKELYELVEQAIDYCDDAACLIHSILLKNV
jgi:predicted phosphate transport protein (TIGR00153 family)